MSLLVTVARYQTITGDTATAASAASAAIEDATEMLAEELGRPGALKSDERTEDVIVGANGDMYPTAVPITVAAGFTFDTHTVFGGSPDSVAFRGLVDAAVPTTMELTYTGGWIERSANPAQPDRLPAYMERDIAVAAYAIAHPGTPMLVPAGAVSASVGDASVSFGSGGVPGGGSGRITWSAETLRWRRRRV